MDQSSVVVEGAVSAHQGVVCDCCSENLHAQGVCDQLLGLLVEVWVDQGHVVVAGDAVPEGRQLLLNPPDLDVFRKAGSDVSELVVGGGVGHQQSLFVPCGCSADDLGASDGGLYDGDVGSELGLEDTVEVV